jgi:tRNA G26 N,N-dimethylase Trm1
MTEMLSCPASMAATTAGSILLAVSATDVGALAGTEPARTRVSVSMRPTSVKTFLFDEIFLVLVIVDPPLEM